MAAETPFERVQRLARGSGVPSQYLRAIAGLVDCDCPLEYETRRDAYGRKSLTTIVGQHHKEGCARA